MTNRSWFLRSKRWVHIGWLIIWAIKKFINWWLKINVLITPESALGETTKILMTIPLGIEIVNSGYTTDALGNKIFPEFDDAQMRKKLLLVQDLAKRYMIPASNIFGSFRYCTDPKTRSGPKFPWKKLYDQYQIGMWYDEVTETDFFWYNLHLKTIHYKLPRRLSSLNIKPRLRLRIWNWTFRNGWWYYKKTIEAFQYHFRPEKYDGIMDTETWAILQALNQKYPQK